MPKLKTNKAAKKRFKITAKGKILKRRTGQRHLLTDKVSQEKRKLRRWDSVSERDRKTILPLLPYR